MIGHYAYNLAGYTTGSGAVPPGPGQITDGLILDYDYNIWDGGSTVTDGGSLSNNATMVGTVSQGTDGSGGKYAQFTSNNNFFRAQMSAGSKLPMESGFTNEFTLETVVYLSTDTKFHDRTGITLSAATNGSSPHGLNWNMWQYDTSVGGVYTGGIVPGFNSFYSVANAPVYSGNWYHAVYFYTNNPPTNNVQYLNGTSYSMNFTDRLNSTNWNGNGTGYPSNLTNWYILAGGDPSRNPGAYVACHRIYNRILTSGEVASQYAYWQGVGYTGL